MASCVHIARLDFYASSFTLKVTLLSWGTEIFFHPQNYIKAAVKIFSQEFVLFLRCHLVSGHFAQKDVLFPPHGVAVPYVIPHALRAL